MPGALDEGWLPDLYNIFIASVWNSSMCYPEALKLSRIYSKILRYKHHSINLDISETNACIPRGLRLKKTPCIWSDNPVFYENWSNVLKETEKSLVSLLKLEVLRIEEKLARQLTDEIEIVKRIQGDEYSNELLQYVHEGGETLKNVLKERRQNKWNR